MSITKYHSRKNKKVAWYKSEIQIEGVTYRKAGFKTIKEAQEWEVNKTQEVKKQKKYTTPGGFVSAAEEYLNDCYVRFGYNTVRQKKKVIKQFQEFLGDKNRQIVKIDRKNIKNYIYQEMQKRGVKAANRDLRDLSAFFKYCVYEGLCEHNPCNTIRKYPEQEHKRYVPPPEDIKAVLMCANREEMDLLVTYCNTAARQGELFKLKKKEVDLKQNIMLLATKKRKNSEHTYRPIKFGAKVREILERRMSDAPESEYVFTNPRTGRPYHKNQHVIKFMLPRLCKKAGVTEFTTYAIRHYISTLLQSRAGVSVKEIQNFLGHARQSTTDTYLRSLLVDQDNIADFLDQQGDDDLLNKLKNE